MSAFAPAALRAPLRASLRALTWAAGVALGLAIGLLARRVAPSLTPLAPAGLGLVALASAGGLAATLEDAALARYAAAFGLGALAVLAAALLPGDPDWLGARFRRGRARPRRRRGLRPGESRAAARPNSRVRDCGARRAVDRGARALFRLLRRRLARPDDRGLHLLPPGLDRGRDADRRRPLARIDRGRRRLDEGRLLLGGGAGARRGPGLGRAVVARRL